MKKNVKNNQADFLLGPSLRVSHDWSFLKKNRVESNGVQWKDEENRDLISDNTDCEIYWAVEKSLKGA